MRVLPALSSVAEVTLWTDQAKIDPVARQFAEVRNFSAGQVKWEELNRADACLYNIGNNPLFHGGIWQLARKHAGIVILHDTRLHHFFDGLYRVKSRDLSSYLAVMEFYYGAEGYRAGADCFRHDARNINEMAERFPLTDHALENSLGVVVHTQQAFEELSDSQDRPATYLPLPFAAGPVHKRNQPDSTERACRLVMFGYIGRNRRLDAVLRALGEMPEQDRFHLEVFGEILDDERKIKSQIRELGLKPHVTLRGFALEPALDEALAEADLAINLRYPTMGEASGSQLRIWSHSLPSLVSKVGWYSTVPAEAVMHIRADENEVPDIQSALRKFLERPDDFVALGREGRRILEEQHSPEAYARGLVDFVCTVKTHRSEAALNSLAERTGEIASGLFGQGMRRDVLAEMATQIHALSGLK